MADDRGQSSTMATILMVAVLVVAAGVTGVWALSFADELRGGDGSSQPTAALQVDHGDGTLAIEHGGGSTIDVEDAVVVLSSGGELQRVPLSSFGVAAGDGDGDFEASERRTYDYTPRGERLDVVVVDEPSGHPLLERSIGVEVAIDLSLSADVTSGTAPLSVAFTASGTGGAARPAAVDFDGRTIESYGGSQDADGASLVIENGAGVGVYANSWRAVELEYDVTEDTVLRFEFRSDDEGEIHAIGLDSQRSSLSQSRLFALHGTQHWGVRDFHGNYTTGEGWRSYEIPVGEYYTGQMQYLAIGMDGDDDEGTSEFRNVRLYEPNGSGLRYDWSGDSIGTHAGTTLNHTFLSNGTYDVTVTATDAAGNTVNQTTTVTIDPAPAPIDFSTSTITAYEASQDDAGGATVIDGTTLELANNTWKQVSLPTTCNVGPDTVLTFEFRSDREGEIHGIGFDDGTDVDPARIFRLYGTQHWGIDDYATYAAGDGWTAYEIPVGEYYTGSFDDLAFATDDDASAAAHSAFRNVNVYDRSGGTYTPICD
jgi:flagellin-like protein